MLDVVLLKSLLHWMLHSPTHQRDEDIIRTLTLVDFCWFQRITKRRFKKRFWRQLKGACILSSIATIPSVITISGQARGNIFSLPHKYDENYISSKLIL